jgi:hypothetical protein
MKDSFSFGLENIFKTTEQRVLKQKRERKIEAYKCEISKFLSPPYLFDLPPTGERLKETPEDQYYMCRNGNRMIVLGFIDEIINDCVLSLTAEQKEILQRAYDTIFNMPSDESIFVRHYPTEFDMQKMRDSIQEAYGIVCSLLKSNRVKNKNIRASA